ncbi:hypothetical protein BJ166DRAFT_495774 [Pestalotiopsis sp. NC0098]|nr:hypothetical protein BJ166DRAFT_495774 [Pestalotiopsis sp. NC0098]
MFPAWSGKFIQSVRSVFLYVVLSLLSWPHAVWDGGAGRPRVWGCEFGPDRGSRTVKKQDYRAKNAMPAYAGPSLDMSLRDETRRGIKHELASWICRVSVMTVQGSILPWGDDLHIAPAPA